MIIGVRSRFTCDSGVIITGYVAGFKSWPSTRGSQALLSWLKKRSITAGLAVASLHYTSAQAALIDLSLSFYIKLSILH